MKKLIWILLSFVVIPSAYSQTETRVAHVVRGQVINEATNEPVPYTNIGIEDTFYGTASDDKGNFQLKVPEEMTNKQIFFSAVGYSTRKLAVKSLFEKEFNIVKLESHTYDIEDIDIAARSKVLARILRMASENTHHNFLSGPFNFICKIENEKTAGGSQPVITTAEALIYDRTGYREPSKSNEFAMRKYELRHTEPAYSFASGNLYFDELLDLDWVRTAGSVLNPALSSQFELTLHSEPEIDGNEAWVIAFRQENPTPAGTRDFHATSFEGKITIMKDDYSVKKIEGTAKSDKHNRQGKFLAVGPSVQHYYEDVSYDFEIIYAHLKPDVIRMNKQYRYNGEQVKETSQAVFTGVYVENVKEISQRNYFPH